jgi:hypothetical protein
MSGLETVRLITDAAGFVLIAPFLPVLFRRLDLLAGNAFRDDESTFRALDALSALLRGAVLPPNPLRPRPLERLLCGLPDGRLLPPVGEPPPEVLAMANGLLGSVLEQWSAVGRTTVAGLREAFLQRQGTLSRRDGGWRLVVEPKAWDVLIDRLPWGFRLLRYPWMPEPIHVSWRDRDG